MWLLWLFMVVVVDLLLLRIARREYLRIFNPLTPSFSTQLPL